MQDRRDGELAHHIRSHQADQPLPVALRTQLSGAAVGEAKKNNIAHIK